jgi:hypothetical protein
MGGDQAYLPWTREFRRHVALVIRPGRGMEARGRRLDDADGLTSCVARPLPSPPAST